ncbi:MAG: polyprenyl synthetase family protein [Clostridia bacterium]|nr:polyprenyl synthetase family protein [Clostridia bacterium]
MDFKENLKEYQEIVNNELQKYVRKEKCPEEILNNSMEYSLMAGGKRLRPILAIATYQLFKSDYEKVMPYAMALEMVHNFSLIHDDLPGIDNDDFRHGKPTNHKQFNEATAILAGDGLLNCAFMVISDDLKNTFEQYQNQLKQFFESNKNEKLTGKENILIELNNKTKVFNEFTIAIDRMIAGEYVDTEFEGKQITGDLLEYIHKNKTGAFLKYSVRMGAILANAKEEEIEKLTKYAENIGLAFQIKDDILSEEGDEAVLGKPVGNDKEKGKCTYVSKYGLQGAKEILDRITNEAVEIVKEFDNSEFLQELAIYIKKRNK